MSTNPTTEQPVIATIPINSSDRPNRNGDVFRLNGVEVRGELLPVPDVVLRSSDLVPFTLTPGPLSPLNIRERNFPAETSIATLSSPPPPRDLAFGYHANLLGVTEVKGMYTRETIEGLCKLSPDELIALWNTGTKNANGLLLAALCQLKGIDTAKENKPIIKDDERKLTLEEL